MRLGQKLRDAIASNFIEIRREEGMDDTEVASVPTAPKLTLKEEVAALEAEVIATMTSGAPLSVPPAEPVVATVPTPAPEPVATTTLTPPNILRALGSDGELNDDHVYAAATLAPVAFTAEQAIGVLVTLPYEASQRTRFTAMKDALTSFHEEPIEIAPQVVADAAQKMVALNKFLADTRDQVKSFRIIAAEELERLHDEIHKMRQMLDELNANHDAVQEAGRLRVDYLTGVIAFFDEFQAFLRIDNEGPTPDTPTEEFPFMREDTAQKLLGVVPKEKAA